MFHHLLWDQTPIVSVSVMCPLRVIPGLAHLDRQLTTLGELLPETLLPCFVLEMFISHVIQLLVVLHKLHNGLVIRIREINVGHVPLSFIMIVTIPPLLQPLFPCHFLCCCASPSLLPPSPDSSTGYPSLCPSAQIQEHCHSKLLSSSLFCLSWDSLSNNSSVFVKQKS